jgi:uncharacterized membrane protein YeaQ/YmgE (transglycosylase-associated protein family)
MALLLEAGSDRGAPGGSLLSSVVSSALSKLSGKVDEWSERLDEVASGTAKSVASEIGDQASKGLDDLKGDGDAKQQATVAGVVASVRGKNPLWAALKAAWSGGGAATRAAIITAIVGAVILLVVSPVLLLVFLLSLLVIAAVMKARSTRH